MILGHRRSRFHRKPGVDRPVLSSANGFLILNVASQIPRLATWRARLS
jgi:hypothetical protein